MIIVSIATEVMDRSKRQCNIIVKYVPTNKNMNYLIIYHLHTSSIIGKVVNLKCQWSRISFLLIKITVGIAKSAEMILASSPTICSYLRNLSSPINIQVCEELTITSNASPQKPSPTVLFR